MSRKKVWSDEDIVAAIGRCAERNGYPPSIREIMAETGMRSTRSMHYRLRDLRAKGLISFEDRMQRTIRIERKDGDSGHPRAD